MSWNYVLPFDRTLDILKIGVGTHNWMYVRKKNFHVSCTWYKSLSGTSVKKSLKDSKWYSLELQLTNIGRLKVVVTSPPEESFNFPSVDGSTLPTHIETEETCSKTLKDCHEYGCTYQLC